MHRLLITVIALGCIIFPQPIKAEQALTVSASPVFSLVNVNPGSSATRKLTLNNKSALPLTVAIETRGFTATDDHGGSDFPNSKSGPQHWFSFSPSSFQIGPHSAQDITTTIKVPLDAVSGGQYASVFFVASAPPDPLGKATQVNFSARIGTFFFMTVGGNIQSNGEVTRFSTNQFWQHSPVNFQIAVHNFGNIHIKPHSTLAIKNVFGKTVEQDTDAGLYVLPGLSRRWELQSKNNLKPGHYTAVLSTKISAKSKTTVKTIGFWILPWQLIIILLLIVFMAVIILKPQIKSLAATYVSKGGKVWLKNTLKHVLTRALIFLQYMKSWVSFKLKKK
jgi:hypothetical protein